MAMIKVVVIDPYTQTVYETRIDRGSLNAIYDTIGEGCDMFEAVYPMCLGGDCMFVDEEGKLGRQTAGFKMRPFEGDVLMGRAIILGTDEDGNSASTIWTDYEIQEFVTGWVRIVAPEPATAETAA